jgi:DNA-binding MarR family transcriptional regulator
MATRRQKIEELMGEMQSLRRSMAFRPLGLRKTPRITPSQWGVIRILGQKDGTTVKDVAHSLRISSSAATQLIDGLVDSGYVAREEHAEDRRRVTLTLSAKSRNQIEKMRKQGVEQFLKFFKALNDKEFDQYIRLSKKITGQFRKQK